jgi:hypothetical protein
MPPTPSSALSPALALTPEVARRAIYLDFEGFVQQPPALVGVLIESSFEIIVLDPVLRTAAAGKGLRVADGAAVLCDLAERARREARLICGFGDREKEASLADFGVDLSDRYLNVHPVAKRRWKAIRSERPVRRSGASGRRPGRSMRHGGYSLDFFEKGLGLDRPRHLAPGLATQRLRAVREPLERHGEWSRMTATARAKWQKLLRLQRDRCAQHGGSGEVGARGQRWLQHRWMR